LELNMNPVSQASRGLLLACITTTLVTGTLPGQSQSTPRPVVTTGTIVRGNGTVIIVSEPAERFASAREALARHHRAQALADMRDAATFVRGQVSLAGGTTKADLAESARDLDRIAVQVQSGKLNTPRELDAALRRTDRGLARHHLERAMRAWERRQSNAAGRELRTAAQYTERLARDAGTGVERGTTGVVRGTRKVSSKLIDGAGWTVDEVGKAFGALGREIDRLGADIAPRQS
jgi:hypothetical protein